jgi:hypothetical protein
VALSALLAACVAALTACGGAASSAPPAEAAARSPYFARDSIWNAPLAPRAPLDQRSRALVAELRRQVAAWGTSVNTVRFSTPVYTVGPSQARVAVELDKPNAPALANALRSVPLPPNALPAAGSDANLVLHQPATDTMWEFWRLRKQGGVWRTGWGGRLGEVSRNPGYFRNRVDAAGRPIERAHWGATATSLAKAGGLILTSELRAGDIPHALAIGIPRARAEVFSAPAQRTDGVVRDPGAIPEGARLRIDPRVDLSRLRLPRATLALARAAQRYGIVVNNQSGAVAFYAQDPTPTGRNPYPALFGGLRPVEIARAFPWRYLQALRLDLRRRPVG